MYLRTTVMGALSGVYTGNGVLSAPLRGLCKAGVYAELVYTYTRAPARRGEVHSWY